MGFSSSERLRNPIRTLQSHTNEACKIFLRVVSSVPRFLFFFLLLSVISICLANSVRHGWAIETSNVPQYLPGLTISSLGIQPGRRLRNTPKNNKCHFCIAPLWENQVPIYFVWCFFVNWNKWSKSPRLRKKIKKQLIQYHNMCRFLMG